MLSQQVSERSPFMRPNDPPPPTVWRGHIVLVGSFAGGPLACVRLSCCRERGREVLAGVPSPKSCGLMPRGARSLQGKVISNMLNLCLQTPWLLLWLGGVPSPRPLVKDPQPSGGPSRSLRPPVTGGSRSGTELSAPPVKNSASRACRGEVFVFLGAGRGSWGGASASAGCTSRLALQGASARPRARRAPQPGSWVDLPGPSTSTTSRSTGVHTGGEGYPPSASPNREDGGGTRPGGTSWCWNPGLTRTSVTVSACWPPGTEPPPGTNPVSLEGWRPGLA